MAQDQLLLSDGSSRLRLSDGVSVLLLSTFTGGAPPELDLNPYRRFYRLDSTGTYRLDARATYRRS